ncbi:MAG: metal ABC transporter permease [Pseudomonadota bacterium]
MNIYNYIIQPFADYGFMQRALAACITQGISSAPLGVFLVLRRMTLLGDAASHAILPGAAIAFMFFGVAILPMTIGGIIAGLLMAIVAGFVTRFTSLKEDASFTAAYLTSLAAGVMIISSKGSNVDLLHILFGNILAVDADSLKLLNIIASISLITIAAIYRPLIMECFEPGFLKIHQTSGAIYHHLFLILVVLNMVAAFQAVGTLMATGIMILPAISSRLWTKNINKMIFLSMFLGVFSSFVGLLLSYHFNLPSGPAIIIVASFCYIISVLFGYSGGLFFRFFPPKHFHI